MTAKQPASTLYKQQQQQLTAAFCRQERSQDQQHTLVSYDWRESSSHEES